MRHRYSSLRRQSGFRVGRLGDVEEMEFAITIIQGEDLIPKDRSFFGLGRLTSSDPYAKITLVQQIENEDEELEVEELDDDGSDDDDDYDYESGEEPELHYGHDDSSSESGDSSDISEDLPVDFDDDMTDFGGGGQPGRVGRKSLWRKRRTWITTRLFGKATPQEQYKSSASPSSSVVAAAKGRHHLNHHNCKSSCNNNDNKFVRTRLGRTRTIYKTLHPYWGERKETFHGSVRGPKAWKAHTSEEASPAVVEIQMIDEDQLTKSDPLGHVCIPLPTTNVDTTHWYDIIPPPDYQPERPQSSTALSCTDDHHPSEAESMASESEHRVPPPQQLPYCGRIQVRLTTKIKHSYTLVPGNQFELGGVRGSTGANIINEEEEEEEEEEHSQPQRKKIVRLGLNWDHQQQQQLQRPVADLDVSCVAISHGGHVIMPDTVYYGNRCNSNHSVILQHNNDNHDDEQEEVDKETITFHLHKIPKHVMAMYVLVAVPATTSTNATTATSVNNKTLRDLQSIRARLMDVTPSPAAAESNSNNQFFPQEHTLCSFATNRDAHGDLNNDDNTSAPTAMFLLRLARAEATPMPPKQVSFGTVTTVTATTTTATTTEAGTAAMFASNKWILTPIQDVYPKAHDFGSLLPHVKAYSRDLLPLVSNNNENSSHSILKLSDDDRVAILRKGDKIRVQDYCLSPSPKQPLPTRITFGLVWDSINNDSANTKRRSILHHHRRRNNHTDNSNSSCADSGSKHRRQHHHQQLQRHIDLDASIICLDANLNVVDIVWWKQLNSKDYNIIHRGDTKNNHDPKNHELIDLYLHNMNRMGDHCHVHYIGFVINSYTGYPLNDIMDHGGASCHWFDPDANMEIATYSLTKSRHHANHMEENEGDDVTALLVGCLYRAKHQQHDDHEDHLNATDVATQNPGKAFPSQPSCNSSSYGSGDSHRPGPCNSSNAQDGEWCLKIVSEARNGRTVKSNVEGFRDYLRRNPTMLHPPSPPPDILGNDSTGKKDPTHLDRFGGTTTSATVMDAKMPPFAPLAEEHCTGRS